jgi:Tfp pilus assembly protein PilN
MINLLPPEGHRAVKQEYFFRVGAAILLLLASVAIFLTIAFIPTYVLIGAQISSSGAQTTAVSSEEETYRAAEATVKDIEKIITQLEKRATPLEISSIIEEIRQSASPQVVFKTFRVDASKAPATIQVQGIAETRESLARFRTALEASDMFLKAEVPISDLARETELPFTIAITPEM